MSSYVSVDLHRHRSVVMSMDAAGEIAGWVRIANDPDRLVAEVLKCAESPEVAIEATYGWYWAVDALETAGVNVHLVAPSKVAAFDGRRVKNDQRDCQLLGDLLRANLLPEAWISPPQVREWRELVRYRAKLVAIRSGLKSQIHAVLAKQGIHIALSDIFGPGGRKHLADLSNNDPRLRNAFGVRIDSLLGLIDAFDHEICEIADAISHSFAQHRGYKAIQAIDGIGPTIAAILCAEIGDVGRFRSAGQLASWCGLTPRHRESDTTVRRGPITKQGSKLARWAAIEAAQKLRHDSILHQRRDALAAARGNQRIAKVAIARRIICLVYYGLRDGEIRCLNKAAS